MRRIVVAFALAVSSLLVAPAFLAAQERSSDATVVGITQPSERRRLPFAQPGIVADVVKEGAVVKQGDVLGKLDDYLEQKELERLELEANSKSRIEAAEADLEFKRAVLKRKEKMFKDQVASEQEVEEARLETVVAEKRLKLAEDEVAQSKVKVLQQKRKVELMTLLSPIDGIVEKVNVGGGELSDQARQDGAVVVVKNDPLYVEVRDLNTRQVAMLKLGEKLRVRYADDVSGNWHDAEIFFFAPVADAASDTRLIKLRLPNPSGRAAGLQLMVRLPDRVAKAAAADGTARVNP